VNKIDRLIKLQTNLVESVDKLNAQLNKMCALLVSDQILQETVSPDGEVRSPEQCASIIKESFNASLCLSKSLDDDCKQFDYSVSEFFVDDEDTEEPRKAIDISDVF
jgi:hypothetical protein